MTQFKTLVLFAILALMITGIASSSSFLRQGEVKTSGLKDCPTDQYVCGKMCCEASQQCYGWGGRFWCA